MTCEMHADAELLNTLLDEAPAVHDRMTGTGRILSAKLVAHWTGLSVKTISDYRTGNLNIPVRFWCSIMEHMPDPRIVRLITPPSCYVEIYSVDHQAPETKADIFKLAVASEMDHAQRQHLIAELLADGRIDELDADTIQKYHNAFDTHRMRDFHLHEAIMQKYRRAKRRAEAAL